MGMNIMVKYNKIKIVWVKLVNYSEIENVVLFEINELRVLWRMFI